MHVVISNQGHAHLPLTGCVGGYGDGRSECSPQKLFKHAAQWLCHITIFHKEGCTESIDMVLCRQVSFQASQMEHHCSSHLVQNGFFSPKHPCIIRSFIQIPCMPTHCSAVSNTLITTLKSRHISIGQTDRQSIWFRCCSAVSACGCAQQLEPPLPCQQWPEQTSQASVGGIPAWSWQARPWQ